MEIIVERLRGYEEYLWDEFVDKSEKATFFHQIGWKNVVENSYGFSPYYLVAKKENEIAGILPLFNVDKRLISVPFAPYGGPLAEDKISCSMLLKSAADILKNENLKFFELRNLELINDDFLITETPYNTFFIGLDCGQDQLWQQTSKSARRLVNKATQSGITIKMDISYLKDFYHLYTIVNKDFGTPVHSYDFFRSILDEFPGKSTIHAAILDNNVIGAKFLLFHKMTIVSGWAVTDKNYRKLSPNGLLTWDILKFGCNNNFKIFDFGRSESQTGSFNFKNKWGEPHVRQIYTQYGCNNIHNIQSVSKFSNKRKIFSKIYSSIPLGISIKIGPHIRKHFP